jgi:hypothetical protein
MLRVPRSHAPEAVKEPHFLDFRLCKINNLQVKNCQFWEFFYSLASVGMQSRRASVIGSNLMGLTIL